MVRVDTAVRRQACNTGRDAALLGNAGHVRHVHAGVHAAGGHRREAAEPVGFGDHRVGGGGKNAIEEGKARGPDAALFVDGEGGEGVSRAGDAKVRGVFPYLFGFSGYPRRESRQIFPFPCIHFIRRHINALN